MSSEARLMTIDDLLKNSARLAGPAQQSLATRRLKSQRSAISPRQQAPVQSRDIPTSAQDSPLPNPPLTKGREGWGQSQRENMLENKEQERQAGVSLREQVLAAKQEEAKKKEKEEEKAATGEEATGTKKWSARALALAFWFLPTMIFFVPAILYIDIHILLRWVLGEKFFCKLGDESGITKIANITGKLAEGATKEYRKIADIIIVLFSNVVFLSTVFTVVAVITAVAGAGGGQGWRASDYVGAASNATAAAAAGAWLFGWELGPVDWLGGLSLWGISNILWGAQTGLQMIGQ